MELEGILDRNIRTVGIALALRNRRILHWFNHILAYRHVIYFLLLLRHY